jgi:hypothetical protein
MNYDYMTEEEELIDMGREATAPFVDAPAPFVGADKSNKYLREIKSGVMVDVYDVLTAWDVRNPALQHLIKKALQAGNRGHKDLETDMQDIIDSAIRAKELEVK